VAPYVPRVRGECGTQQAEDSGDRRSVLPPRRPCEQPFFSADLPDQGKKRFLIGEETEDFVCDSADLLVVAGGGEPSCEERVCLSVNGDIGGTCRFRRPAFRVGGSHCFQYIRIRGKTCSQSGRVLSWQTQNGNRSDDQVEDIIAYLNTL
jgi:hypothetical protein